MQSAYTIKELRELTKIPNVRTHIDNHEMQLGLTPSSLKEAQDTPAKKRILQLMEKIAKDSPRVDPETLQSPSPADQAPAASQRNIWIRFLLSPKEFVAAPDKVDGLCWLIQTHMCIYV